MKNRIIDAFIEELISNGMKFTMDDVAKRLGISKRTLYSHFSSKASILDEIIDITIKTVDEKTAEIVDNNDLTLLQKIESIMMVLPSHYELYDLRILEQMQKYYPQQWTKIDRELKDDWDTLNKLLEQGIDEGIIKKHNVALISKLIIDATNSTLDQRFYFKNNISIYEALKNIVEVLLYGLVIKQ